MCVVEMNLKETPIRDEMRLKLEETYHSIVENYIWLSNKYITCKKAPLILNAKLLIKIALEQTNKSLFCNLTVTELASKTELSIYKVNQIIRLLELSKIIHRNNRGLRFKNVELHQSNTIKNYFKYRDLERITFQL